MGNQIITIVDAPEISLAENEKAWEALQKFYRSLGWNEEDILDPRKVRTTKAVYDRLYDVMYEKCGDSICVRTMLISRGPGTDDYVSPGKVYLHEGWTTPAKSREEITQMYSVCYTEAEINKIINDSLEVYTNLFPYYCRENNPCWPEIKRHIKAVIRHKITPDKYWHGNESEFSWLLTLLSSNYPSTQELLNLAKKRTSGEIKLLADHFYQHVNVMFEYVETYHGYVVLRPSSYMLNLYPDVKDNVYVYTSNKWAHKELSDINDCILILRADEIDELPRMLKVKLGLIY